jgi:N-acetylmuramoyl-L-alanine amidase
VALVGGCATTKPGTAPSVTPSPDPAIAAPGNTGSAPGPPREPTVSPTTRSAGVLLCRDSWGARPARPGGKPHTLTRMTIHHSGVVLGDNRKAPGRLRQHQRYHQDQLGWIDIAYHVSVDRNGDIYELRTPTLAGDTATDYDTTGHFLVLCEGDFDVEEVTDAQLNGAALVFAWAAQTFGLASDTLAGHRDVAPTTSCPGANLYSHLTSGDLKRRIDALLATGSVSLQKICGPDAAAVVADIEAGR